MYYHPDCVPPYDYVPPVGEHVEFTTQGLGQEVRGKGTVKRVEQSPEGAIRVSVMPDVPMTGTQKPLSLMLYASVTRFKQAA